MVYKTRVLGHLTALLVLGVLLWMVFLTQRQFSKSQFQNLPINIFSAPSANSVGVARNVFQLAGACKAEKQTPQELNVINSFQAIVMYMGHLSYN